MRLPVISSLLMVCTSFLSAQAPFPNDNELKQFKASKTCVVLEDDPVSSYNIYIRDVVKSLWTMTPYEFITVREFNVKRLNPAYSFIVITQTNFDKDPSHGLYNFLNLLQGKDVNLLSEMPEICAVPLSFAGVSDLDYSYKLGPIVEFMQRHARAIFDDPSLTLRKYLRYYNKNIPAIKDKTILVEKDDLAPEVATIERIKKYYSGRVTIGSTDDVMKSIENRTPNTIFVHKVGPRGERTNGFCFIMLLGTDDGEMYYYSLHNVDKKNPDALVAGDFKELEK